jgi:hypothetical protein
MAKNPAHTPARLAATAGSQGRKVAVMAAANVTDPKVIVAPVPIRLLTFPATGPVNAPTR